MATTPVLTDQTGQQILKALNENNALLGDIRTSLRQLDTAENLVISGLATKKTEEDSYTFYPEFDGEKLLKAYELGIDMLLSLYDHFKKEKYRIPFSHKGVMNHPTTGELLMHTFNFVSNDSNNPLGKPSTYVVNYAIKTKATTLSGGAL